MEREGPSNQKDEESEILETIDPPLTDREAKLILQVIHRDEQLRQRDQLRVMKLKGELQSLRRKGALKALPDSDGSEGRSCARCRTELGRIINRGSLCKSCRLRVCKGCREFGNRTTDWVCCVCHKNMELQAATGEWMNEFIRRPSKRRDERFYVPAADVIKRTIRRSWTISNPTSPRWCGPRSEMRAYSSLPRHQDDNETGYKVEKSGRTVIDTNVESCSSTQDQNISKNETKKTKYKSKSLNASQDSQDDIERAFFEEATGENSKKLKGKIKRQAFVEEMITNEEDKLKTGEKKELTIPKIEIMKRDQSLEEEEFKRNVNAVKEYIITSPNSSKLRERFSKSKMLRNESKSLNVDASSKSSDSGLGLSKSTEDESVFKFDNNFLDAVNIFSRPRSRERSVSSDSSDKNISDLDKPNIKIRKRREYSENRDSSSSLEGNIMEPHISNRVRKLHEVALKQISLEETRKKEMEVKKRSVEFKNTVEFGSDENLSYSKKETVKVRKFKSLERKDSRTAESAGKCHSEDNVADIHRKQKKTLKKQDNIECRQSVKRESSVSSERKKEKRQSSKRGSKKDTSKNSDEEKARRKSSADDSGSLSKRLSRKDKRSSRKKTNDDSTRKETSEDAKKVEVNPEIKVNQETGEVKELDISHQYDLKSLQEFLNIEREYNSSFIMKKKIKNEKPKPLEIDVNPYLEVVGKILPISDDYKLVFISSDSSTKENRSVSSEPDVESSDSSESETDSSKKLISDCDWDYFESALVRPILRDWSWCNAGKHLERASPVFSTSDDNFESPKFTRRTLSGKFAHSPVSSEIELISPKSNRKNIKETSSEISSEQEIEVNLKTPPPIRKKENVDLLKIAFKNNELEKKEDDEKKKGKKYMKKGRRSLKGKTRDTEVDSMDLNKKEESEAVEHRTEEGETINLAETDENNSNPPTNVEASERNKIPPTMVEETGIEGTEEAGLTDGTSLPVDSPAITEQQQDDVSGRVRPKKNKNKRRKNRIKSHSLNGDRTVQVVTKEAEVQVVPTEERIHFNDGHFGFQAQNFTASTARNVTEAFTCNCPLYYPAGNQNFVPVPIPIPVPFPVPTAFWMQNYQNFFYPNFDLFNFYSSGFMNGNDNNGDSGNGVHIRQLNMQRSLLSLASFNSWCQNNTTQEPCLPSTDNKPVIADDNTAELKQKEVDLDTNTDNQDMKPYKETVDVDEVFVEGKKFEEVKLHLKHKTMEDSTVSDPNLLMIDQKSACSSSSEDSDCENRKPVKKSYYINMTEQERKTSDDSDIADISSAEDEKIDEEETSNPESTCSEDEGNPDVHFSEIFVVNETDQENVMKEPPEAVSADTGIILLRHIQTLPEDEINENLELEELSATESMEINNEHNQTDLPTQNEEGVPVDPVIEVPYLSTERSCSASEVPSENVPANLSLVLDENSSERGDSEIKSVICDSDSQNDDNLVCNVKDVTSNNEVHNKEKISASVNEKVETSGDNERKSYSHFFLDTIESRIRHFSQLEEQTSLENEAKYTSLVMITQDNSKNSNVNVITNDTTKLLRNQNLEHLNEDITLKHANCNLKKNSLEEYYTMTLENSRLQPSPRKAVVTKKMTPVKEEEELINTPDEQEVKVVTGDKTLSAVICLEEGLADDDSWVEEIDLEKERENDFIISDSGSGDETSIGPYIDREEELRGYHRAAIDFTLHTIVEESCEESEADDKHERLGVKSSEKKKARPMSATDLEKYFYFDIGGANSLEVNRDEDTLSESSSSIYSDGAVNDDDTDVRETSELAELATSRLEKYFLTGFLGFGNDSRGRESDGSVGSDSEGRRSPEQRRKRLVRARGTSRLHSNSLDNLVQSENEQQSAEMMLDSEDSSTEADEPELTDGQSDTVKRKKKRKISGGNSGVPLVMVSEGEKNADLEEEIKKDKMDEDLKTPEEESEEDGAKTPQPEFLLPDLVMSRDKQQSRDSGFIGSCDDLLKEQKAESSSGSEGKKKMKMSEEKGDANISRSRSITPTVGISSSTPPATGLTRKDSFNNWSSDEETNLMMTKMRQFFKSMVSGSSVNSFPKNIKPEEIGGQKVKPPQLVYFESELTRLMKTVPGIRDDQVKEIVEYLSSEDTWSDSYDSSDYTSSDLEGTAAAYYQRSQLRQEISESCRQIINKFDQSNIQDEEKPKAPPRRNSSPLNRETAFVYQKLVASFNKIASDNETTSTPYSSPPLIAKVMHHIGSRLVALMHEVSSNSSGEGSISSQKVRYHKRVSQKLSNVSSTTEEELGLTDNENEKLDDLSTNQTYFQLLHQLPRSKSHDLLLEESRGKSLRSSSSGVSDIVEEKETSDYERFSWRGSFESALMASDSRSKLTLLSSSENQSASSLAAKRRSAGDLLFSQKSLSREQLDRVRSCGSIGGVALEDKNIWTTGRDRNGRRRSSVPDATSPGSGASADGDEDSSDSDIINERSVTLPRNLQSITSSTTNSLPRLPIISNTVNANSSLSKAQSVQHFLPNVKSARYRPPGYNRATTTQPKRAVSAPGLQVPQPSHIRRERRRNQINNQTPAAVPSLSVDELNIIEASSVPLAHGGSKSANPSPIVGSARSRIRRGPSSIGSPEWPAADDDIDRLVALHHQRQSSSSLGARSDSMASVYSGAGENRYGTVAVRGEVEFGLQYNYKAGALEILVKQCRDLAPVDTKRNRSDPYVKVYLLPDKSKSGKRKTKVKKHTLNPVFDEVLKFHISLNGLETRTLWLTVWHSDMFGRNDFLGEVMIPFENKVFDDPTPQFYALQERTEPIEEVLSYKGDIIIGLKFVPPDENTLQKKGKRSKGCLHVKVKEAKNLTAVKANGTSDPFCKSYLLPDKGRNSKQKTPVQRRTCNPSWNHTFAYDDVSLQELSERCLELTVWDHDRLASNEFLGGLRFSLGAGKHYGKAVDWMDSSGKEISLWQSMLEKPNLWVEGCLPLRPSLSSNSGSS